MTHTERWAIVSLLMLLTSTCFAEPVPVPPRNGQHTVQAMFGGRDVIPLCVVPPREYLDGSDISPGTSCTIVVYRSVDEGKPGTYTREVGRGTGRSDAPWIDIGAKVPCDDPKGGVIYLASCALMNGEWSDLNNRYMTIIWAPMQFEIKEYPAAGPVPGPPPEARAATTGPEAYPGWLSELTGPADGYTVETLPLHEYHEELEDVDFTLTMALGAGPDGEIAGSTDLDPLLALTRGVSVVEKVEVPANTISGRVSGNTLTATCAFAITLHTDFMDQKRVTTVHAGTDLDGTRQPDGGFTGPARTVFRYSGEGDQPEPSTRDWQFAARPTGGGGLAAPGEMEQTAGAVPTGLQTAAMQGSGFRPPDDHMGSISLSVGDTHFFSAGGRTPRVWLDPKTGDWVPGATFARVAGDPAKWYVGPSGVLDQEPVGDGVRAKAIGNGMGEVWGQTRWTYKMPDGRSGTVRLVSIWVVPVGGEALAQFKGGNGNAPGPGGEPIEGAVSGVQIRGNAIMRRARTPVAGAEISLVHLETGGAYQMASWRTGDDGTFRITASGIAPGEYEVLIIKRSADTTVLGPDEDLWPIRKYIINVTPEAVQAGPIAVGTSIKMDRVRAIDFGLRDQAPIRAGQ